MHRFIVCLAVAASAGAVAVAAQAAHSGQPVKGGLYQGSLYATSNLGVVKTIRLKVAANGKSARVSWACGAGRQPSTLQFPIKADGTFRAFSNVGSLTVWSFVGRFVSANLARAALTLKATCDGKGGTVNLVKS